ncbi:polymerase [Spirochaetia bacterium]|nr:polymerase [Spirochaetia bacterium]
MSGKKKKPGIGGQKSESTPLEMAPAVLFTAIVIVFVRMYRYTRNMKQFYWGAGQNNLIDFFSHYKVVFIVISAILALLVLLYRSVSGRFTIKRSVFYYPIVLYGILVTLSFVFSQYKEFAWHGWNERFEGTYVLLCYMLMLFYIINFVKSERNVKQIIYPVAVISAVLSLIGISQYLDHDFFKTIPGQYLITPNTMWRPIRDAAARGELQFNFTLQHHEIYQTVYHSNYVSFYLTLLIPLFILLFITEKKPVKKCLWGTLFAFLLVNLIGSSSAGGFLGMFAAVIIAVILLNKRLIKWWKSVAILLGITALVALCTGKTWFPEISKTFEMALPETEAGETAYFDYIVTEKNTIHMSYAGSIMNVTVHSIDDSSSRLEVTDSEGKTIELEYQGVQEPGTGRSYGAYLFSDPRFSGIKLIPAVGEGSDAFKSYIIVDIESDTPSNAITNWPFAITKNGVFYENQTGALVPLKKIPHIGWKKNPQFGTGRGYIWSRSLPLLRDTIFLGHGADTFTLYFPHNDYVGQEISNWPRNTFVDKPHDLYLGVFINTGGLSLVCLLAIFLIYIVQSFTLYRCEKYEEFCPVAGAGIFIGICGFLAAAITNDSSVSVMPLFYGLLGTGIAINMMVKAKNQRGNA